MLIKISPITNIHISTIKNTVEYTLRMYFNIDNNIRHQRGKRFNEFCKGNAHTLYYTCDDKFPNKKTVQPGSIVNVHNSRHVI